MLTPEELAQIKAHGTSLDGEGLYYVPDSQAGYWRLTLRGHAFFKEAMRTYGVPGNLQDVLSHEELMRLKAQLLRARTYELGQEVSEALSRGAIVPQQREMVRQALEGSLPQFLQASKAYRDAVKHGPNVIPLPAPRNPPEQESYWGELR